MEAGYNPADMGPAGPHVLLEGNWCPPTHENLHQLMEDALALLQRHEDAWPFLEPVDVRDVPDYLDIIKVSMGTEADSTVVHTTVVLEPSTLCRIVKEKRRWGQNETKDNHDQEE